MKKGSEKNKRDRFIQARLSSREYEILEEIRKRTGLVSISEILRYCIIYTHYGIGSRYMPDGK